MDATHKLVVVKLIHTLAWAFFAGCILAIVPTAWLGKFQIAFGLIGVVMVEVLILVLNRWRCPLTNVAERFTSQRQDNFDIYLPLWLARYNKQIFGSLYVLSNLVTLVLWWMAD
ncbi:MAG: hypothetical protein H6510_02590 [Acidobacteria bacterium]|nr:hypothetical protein [Acidobacteriota bacterium]MCB9396683.1 hypothetical protein [Acidobacteriota bacterium]